MAAISSYDSLLRRAKKLSKTKGVPRAAVIVHDDPHCCAAVARGQKDKIMSPIFLGKHSEIKRASEKNGIDFQKLPVLEYKTDKESITQAIKMILEKQVDFLYIDDSKIDTLVKIILDRKNQFRRANKLLNHLAVFGHKKYYKLLMLADSAINARPTLKKKLSIIENVSQFANQLGIKKPKIAVLAAVEVVYPQMASTTDGAVLAKMSDRKQLKGAIVDGPLSLDCALLSDVAKDKGVVSEVAGDADILIAPNIATAYGTFAAMSLVANARTGALILGGAAPIAISARSDEEENIYSSILLGSYAALTGNS